MSDDKSAVAESDDEDDESSPSKRRGVVKDVCSCMLNGISLVHMLLLQVKYLKDIDVIQLVPLIKILKSTHDKLVFKCEYKPFYGNDSVKEFLEALCNYAL